MLSAELSKLILVAAERLQCEGEAAQEQLHNGTAASKQLQEAHKAAVEKLTSTRSSLQQLIVEVDKLQEQNFCNCCRLK